MRVIFDDRPTQPRQPSLFELGADWMRAANEWALSAGFTVTRWRVDQRFQAGDRWHAVTWNDTTNQWEIQPC